MSRSQKEEEAAGMRHSAAAHLFRVDAATTQSHHHNVLTAHQTVVRVKPDRRTTHTHLRHRLFPTEPVQGRRRRPLQSGSALGFFPRGGFFFFVLSHLVFSGGPVDSFSLFYLYLFAQALDLILKKKKKKKPNKNK